MSILTAVRREIPTHAQMCVIAKFVLQGDPQLGLVGADQGDFEEAVKVACARNRLRYDCESVRKAVDAVLHVHRKGQR